MIFNVNVQGTHQRFVLLKPKLKTLGRRNGHMVCASKCACRLLKLEAHLTQRGLPSVIPVSVSQEFKDMKSRGQ